jgi:hypothetical protein
MLFFTGSSNESTSILKHQRMSIEERDGAVLQALGNIKQVALEIQVCLAGEINLTILSYSAVRNATANTLGLNIRREFDIGNGTHIF